jgi:hypothetical protein
MAMPAEMRRGFARAWLAAFGNTVRRRQPCRSARFYVGRRGAHAEAYVVTRDGVAPLLHHAFYGHAPFDWGSRGAGATELSFSLLCDATRGRVPAAVVAELAADLVADLPGDGFILSADDLGRWLACRQRLATDESVVTVSRLDRWLRALAFAQPWPAYQFFLPMPTRAPVTVPTAR